MGHQRNTHSIPRLPIKRTPFKHIRRQKPLHIQNLLTSRLTTRKEKGNRRRPVHHPSNVRNACRRRLSRISQGIRRFTKQRTMPIMLPASRRTRPTNKGRNQRSKIRSKWQNRNRPNKTKGLINRRLLRTLLKKRTNGLRQQHKSKTKKGNNQSRRTVKMPRPSFFNLQITKNGNDST